MPLPPFAYNVSTTSRGEPITGEDWNFAMGWIGGTTSTGAVDPDAHAHTGLASAGVKINFTNLLAGVNLQSGVFAVAGMFSAGTFTVTSVGGGWFDFPLISIAPGSPITGARRVFVNPTTGKLSVKKDDGSIVSLEEQGGAGTAKEAHIDLVSSGEPTIVTIPG